MNEKIFYARFQRNIKQMKPNIITQFTFDKIKEIKKRAIKENWKYILISNDFEKLKLK